MAIEIKVLSGCGAAEIRGIDAAQRLERDAVVALKRAYLDRPIMVLREQDLNAHALARFTAEFGTLETFGDVLAAARAARDGAKPWTAALQERGSRTQDSVLYIHPEDADVLIMTNETRTDLTTVGIVDNAEVWHSDASHKPEPTAAICLYAVRNPPQGGETEFCDLSALFAALPAERQALLAGRGGIHHWSKAKNPRFAGTLDAAAQAEAERIARQVPEIRQPLVRTHPETGRPSLYISPRFTIAIDGLAPEASEALLAELFGMMEDPRFRYRHEWREGDLILWDNRCLVHRALGGYGADDVRRLYRTTLRGDRPFYRPPEGAAWTS